MTEKLSDYFGGHLFGAERDLIEVHLLECEICRRSLATMDLLSGGESVGGTPYGYAHLSPELLERYYTGALAPGSDATARIESHLQGCTDCATRLGFLKELEADFRIGDVSVKRSPSSVRASFRYIADILRTPAAAYVMALLLVYPAFVGVRHLQQERSDTQPFDLRVEPVLLTEMRRSSSTTPIVHRMTKQTLLRVNIPFYHIADERHYEFAIADHSDSIIAVETISDLSDKGIIHLLVNASALADDTYFLSVREIDTMAPFDTIVYEYSFRLSTQQAKR